MPIPEEAIGPSPARERYSAAVGKEIEAVIPGLAIGGDCSSANDDAIVASPISAVVVPLYVVRRSFPPRKFKE